MKRITFALVIFLFLWGSDTPAQSSRKGYMSAKFKYLPGQIICKFKPDVVGPNGSLGKSAPIVDFPFQTMQPLFPELRKGSLRKSVAADELTRIYRIDVSPETNIPQTCARLQASGLVEYAEPNYLLPVEAVPNDSLWDRMWHLQQVHAPEAWDITRGDSTVLIAIVDTGVDWQHPDLAPVIWDNPYEADDGIDNDFNGYVDDIRGWDFVDRAENYRAGEDGIKEDNNPMDFHGHGTFVAGTAAAATDNHIGISSISWGCRIMPLRAGYHELSGGYIVLSYAAKAFRYAADNGADIINLSTSSGLVLVDAARYAHEKGVVITKSAGNDRTSKPDPLELEPYVLSTAAVNINDEIAGYSDYGDWVKVAAPGGEFYQGGGMTGTFVGSRYIIDTGTSYAAPIVAGLAGLLKAQKPIRSPADIIFQITGTADNIDDLNPSYAGQLGSGRINAYRAVTETVNPTPHLRFSRLKVNDSGGNNDGRINDGETVELSVHLKNNWGDATGLSGEINTEAADVQLQKTGANFDDIAGLSDYANNQGSNENDPFIINVASGSLPTVIPMNLSLTGDNGYSETITFTLPVNPAVLLVDDDGGNQFEQFYQVALQRLNSAWEYWNVDVNGTPPLDLLQRYSTVIWFCSQTGAHSPTLEASDRQVIADYLDAGGSLFLSGQDIGWDLCEDLSSDLDAYNQYKASDGNSKQFYQNYLGAEYIRDDVNKTTVTGVDGDPITDGLRLQFDTPGNGVEYPSEIKPLAGAEPLFTYGNNQVAALRLDQDYRLVYFAFGGIESVLDSTARVVLLEKVLHWLAGISIQHTPFTNTDDVNNPYPIAAIVTSATTPVADVTLYWKREEDTQYQRVALSSQNGENYAGEIPPQQYGTIRYGIVARLADGTFVPVQFYTFAVQADETPPQLSSLEINSSPFAKTGIAFSVQAQDDLNENGMKVMLSYFTSSGQAGEIEFRPPQNDSLFSLELNDRFFYGDSIFYVIRAMDGSSRHNSVELPVDTLVVGLDDFEDLSGWNVRTGHWGLDATQKRSGSYSINDSPYSEINTGLESIIELAEPLDLSAARDARITFWTRASIRDKKDAGYLEVSTDGTTWAELASVRNAVPDWTKYTVLLGRYAGLPELRVRFRLVTSPEISFESSGWYIDDFYIQEEPLDTGTQNHPLVVPQKKYLSANYPNPFNPVTRFRVGLNESSDIQVTVHNVLGQTVREMASGTYPAGVHVFSWNGLSDAGGALPAGIYYIRLKTNDYYAIRKVAFVK